MTQLDFITQLNLKRFITRVNRALKRRLRRIKKITVRKQKTSCKGRIYYRGSAILRIDEICRLLEIQVPKEYENIRLKFITDTPLFDKLPNKNRIQQNLEEKEKFSKDYLEKLLWAARKFKNQYYQMITFNHNDIQLIQLFAEWHYAYSRLAFSPYMYFAYELHNKELKEAHKFINNYFLTKISRCNSSEYKKYFQRKNLFIQRFQEHISREHLYVPDCNLNTFSSFYKKHTVFSVRSATVFMDRRVDILSNPKNVEELYHECTARKFIIEETVRNEKAISEFNPICLSTFKISTFLNSNNEVEILMAGIQIGRENGVIADYSDGAILALIDVEGGRVITEGIDKAHRRYDKHPISLKTIKGFEIPKWDEVINVVKELGAVVPEVKSVTWTIALIDGGKVELIDGSTNGDLYVLQEPDQTGKRHLYEKHVASREEDLKKRGIPVYKNRPILTIAEICNLLDVEIPTELMSDKNKLVTDSKLFSSLENGKQIKRSIIFVEQFSPEYYENLKGMARKFKNLYLSIADLRKNDLELMELYVDWQYNFLTIGFGSLDYFTNSLYKKSVTEAKEFLQGTHMRQYSKICNDELDRKKLNNKKGLYERFHKHIKREWLYAPDITLEAFEEFVSRHPSFFCKPVSSKGGGAGARVHAVKKEQDSLKLFNDLKKGKYLIEELLENHKVIKRLNPESLNTIRILTLLTADGETIVTAAVLRCGRTYSNVDNMSAGGVAASIDVKTGRVISDFVDRSNLRCERHFDSSEKIKGKKVPHWDKAINMVIECSKLLPRVRHIGWDIAITSSGVELIEGNNFPGFNVIQMADQVGKLHIYETHIKEIALLNAKNERKFSQVRGYNEF